VATHQSSTSTTLDRQGRWSIIAGRAAKRGGNISTGLTTNRILITGFTRER
jgi:hypothetical protein